MATRPSSGGRLHLGRAFFAIATFSIASVSLLFAAQRQSGSLCSLDGADYRLLLPFSSENGTSGIKPHDASSQTSNLLSDHNDPQYEIPRQAFMIWKSPDLGKYAAQYHRNWLKNEPTLPTRIVMDEECRSLAAKYPNRTGLLQVYDNFPLNVMRADTCRLLVVYYYGGIYRDLDVDWVRPLSDWFMFNASSRIQIGAETSRDLCNWFFGATRYHPCLASVIDLIAERGRNVNTSYEHFVHFSTGPRTFTDGMRRCGAPPAFNRDEMAVSNILHVFGSINWKNVDKTYSSWTDARDAEVQKAKMEADTKKGNKPEKAKIILHKKTAKTGSVFR